MFELSQKDRDVIVSYLKNAVVPSEVGANLMQIAGILSDLKPVAEKKEDAVPVPKKK